MSSIQLIAGARAGGGSSGTVGPLLTAIEALGVNGIVTRTGASSAAARTITGTANRVVVTNGDGVSGNPTLDVGTDVVLLAAVQTLLNKTLTSPTISGGTIDNAPIGGTTPSTGAFTTLTTSGITRIGPAGASTARLNVNGDAGLPVIISRAAAASLDVLQGQNSSGNLRIRLGLDSSSFGLLELGSSAGQLINFSYLNSDTPRFYVANTLSGTNFLGALAGNVASALSFYSSGKFGVQVVATPAAIGSIANGNAMVVDGATYQAFFGTNLNFSVTLPGNGQLYAYSGNTNYAAFVGRRFSSTQTQPYMARWESETGALLAGVTSAGAGLFAPTDATTNAVTNAAIFGHNTTGTPATGIGTGLRFESETSTTENTLIARMTAELSVVTHASRTTRVRHYASDANGEREYMSGGANGSASILGFHATAPIAKPAITGSRGGNAALASLLTELANYGLITDSTTA